jgi:hypothetical protein
MFNSDFYPTPEDVIDKMLDGIEIENKTILEPSAGKGDIIDYLNLYGAKQVLFCEIEKDLVSISSKKGRFLQADFLTLKSHQISHIDLIVMNPPFSADEQHILHAYEITPAGCTIIALANLQTIENPFSKSRQQLKTIIDNFGSYENLGSCFIESERSTSVEIALVKIKKAGQSYSTEFEGFFLEDEQEPDGQGIMSYNIVRDLVNRYVESIKIFDRQLEEAQRMNQLTSGYFSVNISMDITDKDKPIKRAEFKKEMQKSGWMFIFNKMNLNKYSTKGMREDVNKFVEEKTEIPFTMKNIYVMLSAIIQTTEQRMDKAIIEVFDKVTQHYHENRFNVEGWKTNSHFLLNKRFIVPDLCVHKEYGYSYPKVNPSSGSSNFEKIEDLTKAICYITGENYDNFISLRNMIIYSFKVKIDGKYIGYGSIFNNLEQAENYNNNLLKKNVNSEIEKSKPEWGEWFEWGFFRCRAYKKGTMHFEFLDPELWGRFNQRVAKIKGYPLYEKAPDKRTARQKNKETK